MLDNNLLKVSSCQAGKRLRVKLAGQEGRAVGEVDTGTCTDRPSRRGSEGGVRVGLPHEGNRDGQLLPAYGNL